MVTSYNGWAASKSAGAIDIDPEFTAAGRRFPGGVKRGPVSVVFRYLIEQFDRRVEEVDLYDPGDEWGWYFKPSANDPDSISCHSSGTAVDVNATRHPNGKRGTFTAAQVKALREILAELDGVVKWGGDFKRVPDEMHFEIQGSAQEVARVAGRLLSTVPPAPPAAPPEEEEPMAPAVVYVNGHRFVFVNSEGTLYVKTDDGGFEAVPGGSITSAPAATAKPDNSIEVVARGEDGAAWSITRLPQGTWGDWVNLGGKF